MWQPLAYLRYFDYIFLIWPHTRDTFDQFLTHLIMPLLESLDVLIDKGDNFEQNGIFDTKVYFKPTDSHALLHKQSFHPQHTFPGIIKSQLIRFARICKLEKDFNEATATLFGALYRRGYSRRYLRKIKSQIKRQYYLPEEHTGMIPCNGKRCTICKHVNKRPCVMTSRLGPMRV